MCKMCERIDDSFIQEETELDFGMLGKEFLSLETYRRDDKSPMMISAVLIMADDSTIEIEFSASYCPFCGRKLS